MLNKHAEKRLTILPQRTKSNDNDYLIYSLHNITKINSVF